MSKLEINLPNKGDLLWYLSSGFLAIVAVVLFILSCVFPSVRYGVIPMLVFLFGIGSIVGTIASIVYLVMYQLEKH